jgi:hypothetical protein
MADYFQVKNQNIFNPPANTSLGNATNQFNDVYVQNDLVLGNVTVTGDTIIAPRVTTIAYPGDDTAADTAGGQTITITGTGFVAGASVLINGSAVGVVSVVSSTTITIVSPANTTGSYVIYVVNPDGSTAIAIPGIQYSGTPNWTTAAGTLGNVYETASFNQTVTATGDAPITYSVFSGSLPPGSTFNANGTITGTSQLTASPTTYSFTVRATDAEQQDTNRAFSISVIPDVVTWSNPTDNTTYSPAANIAIANITLSATSAVGSGITYTANSLPTGLSLTGANISGTPTVVANTSSLLTATANTTSESSSITINWVVSVASDPYFMYNSLLLPGTGTNGAQNNTFLDGSTNNFTITRNGNTTQGTFSPYGPNWSNYFDGTGDFLSMTTTTALQMTGDFTWEAWVYPLSLPSSGYKTFWSQRANASGTAGPSVAFDSSGVIYLFIGNANASGWAISGFNTGFSVSLNQWQHIALVKNGTSIKLYKNGVAGTSTTSSEAVGTSGNTTLMAGTSDGTQIVDGYMSNFRAVKGTAVYTSNFTPSTTPLTAISGTSLLTCQSNRFIDTSTNAFTITVNGNTNIQRFSPFSPGSAYSAGTIGGSGYFDGATDYLVAPNNAALNLSTADYTIEAWIYYIPTGAFQYVAVYSVGVVSNTQYDYAFVLTNTGAVRMGMFNSTTQTVLISSAVCVSNAWNHVAVTRSGSSATVYVNGIGTTGAMATTDNVNAGATLKIGADNDGSVAVRGYMSDFRIVKGTRVYTSNFTPPTVPLTAIANTAILLNYTNAGIIDNTMMNNLETVGNAQISTAQTKFGGGSMSFDGTGDYLTTPFSPLTQFGTGDFTIEFWIYRSAGSVYQTILDTRSSGTASPWAVLLNSSNQPYILIASDITSSIAVASATWTHVAICRASGTLRIFNNGVVGYSGANSTSMMPTGPLRVGKTIDNAYDLNGYIDDLRITKGIARYTSNFTPSVSAFPTY